MGLKLPASGPPGTLPESRAHWEQPTVGPLPVCVQLNTKRPGNQGKRSLGPFPTNPADSRLSQQNHFLNKQTLAPQRVGHGTICVCVWWAELGGGKQH